MPPRKSNVSTVSNDDSSKAPAKETAKDDGLNIEDLNLPKSIVQRLGKGVLPPNTQIQKDALLAVSKSATVFVNYLTSCAAENAARSGKKTVMPKDVFDAMQELEFEFMLPRVEAEVHKFTSVQADKRNTYRKKVREEKKATKEQGPVSGSANGHAAEEDTPPAKRARMEDGGARSEEDDGVDDTVEVDEDQDVDEEVEDDEVEEDEGEDAGEGLTEDPLEEREEPEDEEMEDGDESD